MFTCDQYVLSEFTTRSRKMRTDTASELLACPLKMRVIILVLIQGLSQYSLLYFYQGRTLTPSTLGRFSRGCYWTEFQGTPPAHPFPTQLHQLTTALQSEGQRSKSSIPTAPSSLVYFCISSIRLSASTGTAGAKRSPGRMFRHFRVPARRGSRIEPRHKMNAGQKTAKSHLKSNSKTHSIYTAHTKYMFYICFVYILNAFMRFCFTLL